MLNRSFGALVGRCMRGRAGTQMYTVRGCLHPHPPRPSHNARLHTWSWAPSKGKSAAESLSSWQMQVLEVERASSLLVNARSCFLWPSLLHKFGNESLRRRSHDGSSLLLQVQPDQKADQELEENKLQVAAKERANPPELLVLAMAIAGAFFGYVTAVAVKVIGRYFLLFIAGEAVALGILAGLGIVTPQRALNIMKFTLPPLEWYTKTIVQLTKHNFRKILDAKSLALRISFIIAFALSLKYARR